MQLCLGALVYKKRGMNQEDVNQMVIHGQTASKMTGHPAVILGLLTIQGTNLGTLGRHCRTAKLLTRLGSLVQHSRLAGAGR